MIYRLLAIVIGSILTLHVACTPMTDYVKMGEASVLEFRERVREGRFAEIYSDSSKGFKDAVNREEFIRGLESIRAEVGDPDRFELLEVVVADDFIEGTFVTVTSRSTIPDSEVRGEKFMFLVVDNHFRLFNYSIEK